MDNGVAADLTPDQPLAVSDSVQDAIEPEMGNAASLQHTAKPAREIATIDNGATTKSRQMFVPSHGNGALLRNPGFPPDMPRDGRPISPTTALRDQMREGLRTMLPSLFAGVKSGKINKLQFADFLAKYSIGATGTVTHISPDVINRLERQAMLVASRPSWDSAELLQAMRDIWA